MARNKRATPPPPFSACTSCGKAETSRREKDAADRSSFAGMALAHADASAELQSRLELANQRIQESEVSGALSSTSAAAAAIIVPAGVTKTSTFKYLLLAHTPRHFPSHGFNIGTPRTRLRTVSHQRVTSVKRVVYPRGSLYCFFRGHWGF